MAILWPAPEPVSWLRWCQVVTLLVLLALVCACSSLSYYSQLVQGQWSLWSQRQPIDELLQQDNLEPALRERLERAQQLRRFASEQLHLPDNHSYRYYTDLKRPYAIWNVFAAPELSMTPHHWCYPFAGCVSYRGYFSEARARAFASELTQQGMDVYVAAVAAYSTLGWFDDPVLNTFIDYHETHLAGLLFHELAHQQMYLPGDTPFSESFARCVEIVGVKRWLQRHQPSALAPYLQHQRMHSDFVNTVLALQSALAELYQQTLSDDDKRRGKRQLINEFLVRHYPDFKARWNGYNGFDDWVSGDRHGQPGGQSAPPALNNARLSSVASYHQWLPAFEQLLRDSDGQLTTFYQRVKQLSEMQADERRQSLLQLHRRSKRKLLN